jgi:hypothetical protein
VGFRAAKGTLGNGEGESGLPCGGAYGLAEDAVAGRTDCSGPSRVLCMFRCHPVTNISPAAILRSWWPTPAHDSYLVDSASSHMLVSKIKPCMSKYKQLYSETANGSLYKLSFI